MCTDRIKTHWWYFVTKGIDTTTSCRARRGLTVVFRGVATMDVTMSVVALWPWRELATLVRFVSCLFPSSVASRRRYNRCG